MTSPDTLDYVELETILVGLAEIPTQVLESESHRVTFLGISWRLNGVVPGLRKRELVSDSVTLHLDPTSFRKRLCQVTHWLNDRVW